MRTLGIAAWLLLLASPVQGYRHWNHIRHSATLPDGNVVIRVENPSGPGVGNFVLYSGGGIVEQAMAPVVDGDSTVSAAVPGPGANPRRCGFRLVQGSELDLMPVRIDDGVAPAPPDLSQLAADPVGDHLFGYVNLDLVECRVSFSGTKIFAALKNAGGGFPVSQGLTFFGYLLAIADPALADPDTVFALMQTLNQPGIITPGLYRITGSGFGDLKKIGSITVQEFPASNTLLLSCNLADLLADPYFLSWYDPAEPVVGIAGFSQRITLLGGAAEADRTPGGDCHLRGLSISPATNRLPALASLLLEGSGPEAFAQVAYSDPDSNCPVVAEIAFDGGLSYPMYPQSLDYGLAVQYRTDTGIAPLATSSWSRAVARFSDNLSDTVTAGATRSGVPADDALAARPPFRTLVTPNPFSTTASIQIEMSIEAPIRVEILDVRGSLVRTIMTGALKAGPCTLSWDGRDESGAYRPSGLYFCRVCSDRQAVVEKLLLAR